MCIRDSVSTVFFPNAITPNGDGKNEFWRPEGLFLDQLEMYELFIYNRWGELIFTSNNPYDAWNGRKNGSIVPSGGYLYSVAYKEPRKELIERNGHIIVLY